MMSETPPGEAYAPEGQGTARDKPAPVRAITMPKWGLAMEEGALARAALPPAPDHGDLVAAGEPEAGNVERVAERVLGDVAVIVAVAAAAAIRGDLFDLHHRPAEIAI